MWWQSRGRCVLESGGAAAQTVSHGGSPGLLSSRPFRLSRRLLHSHLRLGPERVLCHEIPDAGLAPRHLVQVGIAHCLGGGASASCPSTLAAYFLRHCNSISPASYFGTQRERAIRTRSVAPCASIKSNVPDQRG